MKRYKVIFHIDESFKARAKQVLANITNLLDDFGEGNVQVELLANGDAVRMFLNIPDNFSEQIRSLVKRDVKFVACAHSLDHLNLTSAELIDVVEIVPAGVSEIVKKQMDGWAYIRP